MQAMNFKLGKLVTALTEEEMLAFCLELKDDIDTTIDRFNVLKTGRVPPPFKAPAVEEVKTPEASADLLGEMEAPPTAAPPAESLTDLVIG